MLVSQLAPLWQVDQLVCTLVPELLPALQLELA